MAQSTQSSDRSPDLVCSWCSATLDPTMADCPSCGAQLIPTDESDMPGLTSVDVRATRPEVKPRPRNRLLSWISGEYTDDVPSKAEALAVAPPDPAVQQEILRLQLEAELADLQAEAAAIAADALVGSGSPTATDEPAADATTGTPPATTDAPGADVPAATVPGAEVADDAPPSDGAPPTDETAPADAGPEPGVAAAVDAPHTSDADEDRERMRQELEAQIAELQARVDAMRSDDPPPRAGDPGSA
jgi:hypothetical protein